MARSVWKYPLAWSADTQQVPMPLHAAVVHVALQDDVPTVWAEVQAQRPGMLAKIRLFRIVGTGGEVPDRFEYRGTVHHDGFVFHVYEGAQ
jgi:hypothetical protein